MNKYTLYLVAVIFFAACGNGNSEPQATATADTPSTATAEPVAPPVATKKNGITQEDYEKGLALVASSDCLTCHKLKEKLIGPAYKDVADRYTAHPDTLNKLAAKIIKGGVGNWGPIPMTPHPDVSKEDAVQMVKYVLSIE